MSCRTTEDRRRDSLRPGPRRRWTGAQHVDRVAARSWRRRPIGRCGQRACSTPAGLVVMPGGIDMHCHIAGPKTNAARQLRPEENRTAEPVLRTARTHSGTMGSVPSTFATGYRYAGLGYTTAFDAAITPLAARHAHAELADTPCIDKGFYVLVGNNHYLLDAICQARARAGRSVFRLAAFGHQGLCPQAGQSGWRRSLEARQPAPLARRPRAAVSNHAAADHSRRGPGRQPIEAAAFGPHSHGQLGNAGQLDHDARKRCKPSSRSADI